LTKVAQLPTAINGARALLSINDRQGGIGCDPHQATV
jgi:hypothetical protein